MEFTIAALLGGLWRLIDGEPWLPKLARQIALLVLLVLACYYSSQPYIIWPFMIVVTWAALEQGFTGKDWTQWYMWKQYLPFGAVFAGVSWELPVLYIIAGLSYPFFAKMYVNWGLEHYDFYARFVAGGCLVGGLTLL